MLRNSQIKLRIVLSTILGVLLMVCTFETTSSTRLEQNDRDVHAYSLLSASSVTTVLLPLDNTIDIGVGESHSCALTKPGAVKCWGDNSMGQLGDGTTVARSTAHEIPTLAKGVKSIFVGANHNCVILEDLSVMCWGANISGQLGNNSTTNSSVPGQIAGLSDVVDMALGGWHSCAILSDGGVRCWGNNGSGQLGDGTQTQRLQPVPVDSLLTTVSDIVAGNAHTCVLTASGGVKCWGSDNNPFGEDYIHPVDIEDLSSGVAAIFAGGEHTCAITSSGELKCWGVNYHGEFGLDELGSYRTPQDVPNLAGNVIAGTAGGSYTCVVLESGVTKCMGGNYYGQLGNDQLVDTFTPVVVPGIVDPLALVSSYHHTCAVANDGMAKCWGANFSGQLGRSSYPTNTHIAADVIGLTSGVKLVSAEGRIHTCAVTQSGEAKCWGDNSHGQLGMGSIGGRANTPVSVSGLADGVDQIVTGDGHSCALMASDQVKCWGRNGSGQLGNGSDLLAQSIPSQIVGLPAPALRLTAGYYHTCAVLSQGDVWCWGRNSDGQLGNNSSSSSNVPVQVQNVGGFAQEITAGHFHTCVLITGGEVQCWGRNNDGQLGDGSTSERDSPVYVFSDTDGTRLGGIDRIDAGADLTCGRTNVNGLKCWGKTLKEAEVEEPKLWFIHKIAVDVPALTHDVSALTVGNEYACVLMIDNGAKCWGTNSYGHLGDGTFDPRISPVDVINLGDRPSAISAGQHTCAVTGAGGVKCWGYGSDGQLGRGNEWFAAPQDVIEEQVCHSLELSHTGNGSDPSVDPQNTVGCPVGTYVAGETISLIVTPEDGWQVAGWTGTVDDSNTAANNGAVMPDSNHAVSVTYEENPTSHTPGSWTFMLYLAGDTFYLDNGNVHAALGRALQRLGQENNPHVKVVALLDGPGATDSFRVTFKPEPDYQSLGEKAMDNPQTLVEFVQGAREEFPADHYYLVVADHANAVQGIAWDTTSKADKSGLLTPLELEQALKTISGNGASPLDILHFDGCSFGLLEIAAAVKDATDYLVLSQNIGWGVFAYDAYRGAVESDTNPETLAVAIAQTYAGHVEAQQYPYTISTLDMSRLDAVLAAFNDFAGQLSSFAGVNQTNRALLSNLRTQSQKFESGGQPPLTINNDDLYVDLADFAQRVEVQMSGSALAESAGALTAALVGTEPLVIYESHRSGSWDHGSADDECSEAAWTLDGATGISIYYPPKSAGVTYGDYISGKRFPTFHTMSSWHTYLQSAVPALGPGEPIPEERFEPLAPCGVANDSNSNTNSIFLPTLERH